MTDDLRKAWTSPKSLVKRQEPSATRKKVKMIASDEKTEKAMEEEFEQEELKCTRAFVLVGGTMTTCTRNSKKKQAAIREKRVRKYEEVLERCKQIRGGF